MQRDDLKEIQMFTLCHSLLRAFLLDFLITIYRFCSLFVSVAEYTTAVKSHSWIVILIINNYITAIFVLCFDSGNAEERWFTTGFTKHKSDVQMKAEQNNTGLICWPLWSSRGLNVLLKSTPLVATGRRKCCFFTYMPIFFLLVQGSKACHNFTSLTLEVNAAHIFI